MELTHHNLHSNPDIAFTTSVYGAVPKSTVDTQQAGQVSTPSYTTTTDYGYTGAVPGSSYTYTQGAYESPYRKAATGAGDIVFATQSSYGSYKPSELTAQVSSSSQPQGTIPPSYTSHIANQDASAPVSYGSGNLVLGESFLNFATSVDGTSNHHDYARLGSIKPWNNEPYTTTIVNHNLENLIGTPVSYITKQASQVSPNSADAGYRPSLSSQQTEGPKRSTFQVYGVTSSGQKNSILAPYRNSMYPEFELVQDLPDRSNLLDSMNYLLKQSPERESLLAAPVKVSINRQSALSPADIKFDRVLKEKYEDGSIYEGESQHGLAHGKGKLTYKDGKSFAGEFSHGKAQSKGTFYFKNGQVWYDGDVFDFVFEGKGVLKCENPVPIQNSVDAEDFGGIGNYWVKYEGEFKGGKKHGNGVLHFTNGDKFTGEFKGDKVDGRGTFEQRDGKVVKGTWYDNKLRQRD